ncbi:MAG: FAD-dependent oxidoreductase, partial [Gemmatimonadales bacterium]
MGETAVETEVVVIGGGPGGYAAAFRAAQHGLGTTLISDESQGLGGVCLLRGCIPSKALLEMTGRIDLAREAGEAGIGFSEPDVDTGKLRDWCSGVVEALTSGLEGLAEEKGVRVIQGRARFESSSRLRVDDSEVTAVEFGHAVVATGARPVELPDLPFGGPVWDSDRALAL